MVAIKNVISAMQLWNGIAISYAKPCSTYKHAFNTLAKEIWSASSKVFFLVLTCTMLHTSGLIRLNYYPSKACTYNTCILIFSLKHSHKK